MKAAFIRYWNEWFTTPNHELTAQGNLRGPGYVNMLTWINLAWNELDEEYISDSFRENGITEHDREFFHSELRKFLNSPTLPDNTTVEVETIPNDQRELNDAIFVNDDDDEDEDDDVDSDDEDDTTDDDEDEDQSESEDDMSADEHVDNEEENGVYQNRDSDDEDNTNNYQINEHFRNLFPINDYNSQDDDDYNDNDELGCHDYDSGKKF